MVEKSVTLGSATQSVSGATYTLSLDGKTIVYSVGTTLVTPTSPSGYYWTGTQSDGTALPLATVPVVRLCNSTTDTTAGYILIASGATSVQITSANSATFSGKTLYRRDCNGTSAAKSNYLKFNSDGTLTIVEDGSTTLSLSDVDAFFSSGGYTNDLGTGYTEHGLIKFYKATVNGSVRYFAADTGYTTNNDTGSMGDYWVDLWLDEGFY